MKYAAVIFDFFGTLVDNFSRREADSVLRQMASILSAPSDSFIQSWINTFNEPATGVFQSPEANIEYICRKLGVPAEDAQIRRAAQVRLGFTARSIVPRPDSLEVLSQLKSEGYKTGLISDCSAELSALWESTPFASSFDVSVFSCIVGMRKPDPRIYQLATNQLMVEPENCLYVGDGSSQELTGAAKVGMHPVLLRVPGEDDTDAIRIDEEEEWAGAVISSLKDGLTLVK